VMSFDIDTAGPDLIDSQFVAQLFILS